jgi:hypothetical protein
VRPLERRTPVRAASRVGQPLCAISVNAVRHTCCLSLWNGTQARDDTSGAANLTTLECSHTRERARTLLGRVVGVRGDEDDLFVTSIQSAAN